MNVTAATDRGRAVRPDAAPSSSPTCSATRARWTRSWRWRRRAASRSSRTAPRRTSPAAGPARSARSGAIGCFSSQQGKHITSGEGGFVVTDDAGAGPPDAGLRQQGVALRRAEPGPRVPRPQLPHHRAAERGAVRRSSTSSTPTSKVRVADGPAADASGSTGQPGIGAPVVRARRRRTPTGATACASIPASCPAARRRWPQALRFGDIAAAPRYIQKPAFRCKVFADQGTFGTSRWPFTLARPEAVDYARRAVPRHATRASSRSSCCPGTSAMTRRARRLPRRQRSSRPRVAGAERAATSRRADAICGSGSSAPAASPGLRRRARRARPRPRASPRWPTSTATRPTAMAERPAAARRSPSHRRAARGRRTRRGRAVHAAGHARRARRAASPSVGVHVLCEKPLAVDRDAARRRWSPPPSAAGVVLTMATKFRFCDDVNRGRARSSVVGIARRRPSGRERLRVARRHGAAAGTPTRRSSGGGVLDRQRHALGRHRPLLPRPDRRGAGGRGQAGPAASRVEDTAQHAPAHAPDGVLGTSTCRGASTSRPTLTSRSTAREGTIRVGWRGVAVPPGVQPASGRVIGTGYAKGPAMGGAGRRTSARAVRGEAPLRRHRRTTASPSVDVHRRRVRVAAARRLGRSSRELGGCDDLEVSRSHDRPHPERASTATAMVEDGVAIGEGTSVWDSVSTSAARAPRIGEDCIIGEKYLRRPTAWPIGDRVKINAFVYICTGVTIEDGVMISARARLHQRPLPARHDARPRRSCARRSPTSTRCPRSCGPAPRSAPGARSAAASSSAASRMVGMGARRHPVGARLPPRRRPARRARSPSCAAAASRSCGSSTAACPTRDEVECAAVRPALRASDDRRGHRARPARR